MYKEITTIVEYTSEDINNLIQGLYDINKERYDFESLSQIYHLYNYYLNKDIRKTSYIKLDSKSFKEDGNMRKIKTPK